VWACLFPCAAVPTPLGLATWYLPGFIVRNTMKFGGQAGHALVSSAGITHATLKPLLRTWAPAGCAMVAVTLLAPYVGR
jgi:hypothetical protein